MRKEFRKNATNMKRFLKAAGNCTYDGEMPTPAAFRDSMHTATCSFIKCDGSSDTQDNWHNYQLFSYYFIVIVQRKLRWVEIGVNRWVMLQYWGTGHYFLILKDYLVFRIKRFAAT